MKAFHKLFSMLAAIVVSAVLPFSMAAESEASQFAGQNPGQNQSSVSGASVSTAASSEREQDDRAA